MGVYENLLTKLTSSEIENPYRKIVNTGTTTYDDNIVYDLTPYDKGTIILKIELNRKTKGISLTVARTDMMLDEVAHEILMYRCTRSTPEMIEELFTDIKHFHRSKTGVKYILDTLQELDKYF